MLLMPDRELVLIDRPAAPEIFADGAVIITGRIMTRLVLFAVRFVDIGERRHEVVGRLAIPREGWNWSLTGAAAPHCALPQREMH